MGTAMVSAINTDMAKIFFGVMEVLRKTAQNVRQLRAPNPARPSCRVSERFRLNSTGFRTGLITRGKFR
jgi:hypothetical protein